VVWGTQGGTNGQSQYIGIILVCIMCM
jgi:hypothetical protein